MRLESIRNRSGLLMVVIGVAMFAFIMMDLMSSQRGGGSVEAVAGEVYGEAIDLRTFDERVQEQVNTQKQNNPNVNVDQVRNSVWNQMTRELILGKEHEALGVIVGSDELFDMIQGSNPNASVQQAFTNPETGQFDRARLLQYLKEDMDSDPTGESRARWVNFEQALRKQQVENKYNVLVEKGFQVSDWEAQLNYNFQNEIRNVAYIQIPLKTIADSLVEVSDSEMKDYMHANSEKYQQDASRVIEYVQFAVNPSQDDRTDALAWVNDVKSDFAKTTDNEAFVRRYSDKSFTPLAFVSKDNLVGAEAELFNAEEGTVIGPFAEGPNNFRLVKLVSKESRPDSVQARHILLTDANASSVADSLKNLIESGVSTFAALAEKHSQDGSASKGGDLGWFQEGVMVTEFNEACFTGRKGEVQKIVTQFGVHLVEITDKGRSSQKVKLAHLDRNVVPSNQTYQLIFNEAGKFAAENITADQFNTSATTNNLSKRIADNLQETTNSIAGLENPRALVRWAYQAQVGQVSDVFELGDKFVVALLTDVNEEGMRELDDVRDEVANIIRDQKRSEMLEEQLQGATSLDNLAADYGITVKTAEGLSFNNNQVNGIGSEPVFVGAAFATQEGGVSSPITGKSSVFVLRVDNVISAPEGDATSLKQQLVSSLQSRSRYQAYQALQKLADVQDNRANFY